jgi:dihydrofolate reductase
MLHGKWVVIIFASSVYAQDGKLVIGSDGDMPWRGKIPSDMDRFKKLTMYESVIMGRKTWDSLGSKRPLSNRQNIIITRDRKAVMLDVSEYELCSRNVVITNSFEKAVLSAQSKIVWIIGGAEIYSLALPVADLIHHTMVSEKVRGDTFFPEYDVSEWEEIDSVFFRAGGAKNPDDKLDTFYKILERKNIR